MARWGPEPRVLLKILPDRSGQWLPVPRQGRWVRLLRLHPWDQWPPQPRWDRSALPHPQAPLGQWGLPCLWAQ